MFDRLMDYEAGRLGPRGTLELFAELIGCGQVWRLQGSYGRQALGLIEGGWISRDGGITHMALDYLERITTDEDQEEE